MIVTGRKSPCSFNGKGSSHSKMMPVHMIQHDAEGFIKLQASETEVKEDGLKEFEG